MKAVIARNAIMNSRTSQSREGPIDPSQPKTERKVLEQEQEKEQVMAVNDFIAGETLGERANASSPALKKELNYSTQKLEIDRVDKLYYE